MVWNLFPLKGDVSSGKSQKLYSTKIWAVGGLSHLDDLMFCQKTLHKTWYKSRDVVMMKLPITRCPQVWPSESSEQFLQSNVQASHKISGRFVVVLTQSFECEDHTVPMLTQQVLPPPQTSTVKSSLFMHVHSSPLSLAARLHRCCTNHSCYISNGWTFYGQTTYYT